MKTLADLVRGLEIHGRRQAVGLRGDYGVRWWSYRRLSREIRVATRSLGEMGLEPGNRLILSAPNSPEWTALFLAATWRGLVVAPLDPSASGERLGAVAERAGARLIVDADGAGRTCPGVTGRRLASFFEDEAEGSEDPPEIEIDPDGAVAILFTSGSGGDPKGVVLTERNLMFQTRRFRRLRPPLRLFRFRLLSLSPLAHVQGLMLGLFVPLSLGLSVLYSRSVAPYHLMRTLKHNRVHALSTVPRVLELLEGQVRAQPTGRRRESLDDRLARGRWALRRKILTMRAVRLNLGIRFMVLLIGGASLPNDRERFWRRAARILIQGYGLTETTAFVSLDRPWPGFLGSIGRPIAEQELRVAENGELLVRGPHLTPGYLGPGAPSLPLTRDGFLATGDLVRRGRGNRLYFVGRKKDIIVTAEGHNVHPEAIEAVLNDSPAVREAVVVGAERDGFEEIHAVLLLAPEADAAAEIRRANRVLEAGQRIRDWSVWLGSDLPRAALGKVDRRRVELDLPALRAGRASRTAATDVPPSLDQALAEPDPDRRLEAIADYVAAAHGEVSVGELGEELGLDSISTIRLLVLLERKWEVPLAQRVLTNDTVLSGLSGDSGGDGRSEVSGPVFGETKEPPRWQEWPFFVPFRRLLRDLFLLPPLALRLRLRVRGRRHLAALEPPFLLTIHTDNRHHRLDFLALYAALPRRLRLRVAIVAGRWIFGSYLDPDEGESLPRRWAVSLLFNLGMPLFLPFVLVPPSGSTMKGLLSVCRWIDRRHSLVMTMGPGAGLVTLETGIPIVPVRLTGNELLESGPNRRPEVTVTFGAPLVAPAGLAAGEMEERIGEALRDLAAPDRLGGAGQ